MRIAVNTRLLVPDKMDGIGRFTYESLKRISQNNPNVHFVFIFDRNPGDSFQFSSNISIKVLGPQARHPFLWYIWFEHQLKRFVNQGNFDLFISPEGWVPPKLNCKSLSVVHDLNFEHHPENIIYSHRKYLRYYFPKFIQRADRIATVSEFSKNDILKTYKPIQKEIDVVYNGANKIFKPLKATDQLKIKEQYTQGEDFFVFIGTLHPRKNLEHLFKAFEIYKSKKQSKTKLLIVGNRKWWPNELEIIYSSLKHKEEIIFLGRQTDEVAANLIASSIALTYLPYFEGFGIPILEAFQSGTAVITSNVSSMPEVAADAALTCNPRDESEIAKAMQQLAEDETLRKKLIQKGATRAKYFSWDKTAELLWKSAKATLLNGA